MTSSIPCSILILALTISASHAHEIAITFDDLPSQEEISASKQSEINQRILDGLHKFNVPAIGFVNEGKLYDHKETQQKIAILKSWVKKKHALGNHTYSHHSLNKTDLNEFQSDVIK
jgi:peptidoglycan/xylan/chitin deacetylase (PgdA/CDA1 family)